MLPLNITSAVVCGGGLTGSPVTRSSCPSSKWEPPAASHDFCSLKCHRSVTVCGLDEGTGVWRGPGVRCGTGLMVFGES